MRILKLLFSGEFIFSLFLFSSYLKIFLPEVIDISILFLVMSIVVAFYRFIKKPVIYKSTIKPMLLFLILSAILLISYVYTPSVIYGSEKIMKFLILTGWSFIGVFVFVRSKESLEKILSSFILISSTASIYFIWDFLFANTLSLGIEYYLPKAKISGIGTLLILVNMLLSKDSIRKNLFLNIPLFLICLSSLITTGARAPIVVTVLLIVLVIFYTTIKIKKNFKSIKYILLLFITAFGTVYYLFKNGFLETTFWRIMLLFDNSNTYYSTGRSDMYLAAFNSWTESLINFLLGSGIGSFGMLYMGKDTSAYPHNIFLELLVENGLLGVLPFVILLLFCFVYIVRCRKDSSLFIQLILLFIFTLFGANTSGDINDNRILFSVISLIFIIPLIQKKYIDKTA